MITRLQKIAASAAFLSLALFLNACSGSSSRSVPVLLAESEPNDVSSEAPVLALGRVASGDVSVAGDVDFWEFRLAPGTSVQVELFATRLDQATWNTNLNVPRMTIYGADGTTKVLEHDNSGAFSGGFSWGTHDLDIPLFHSGAGGTFFVAITQDGPGDGGAYHFRISSLSLGSFQTEAEVIGVPTNGTAGTAEAILPGYLEGYHVDNELDFYSFTITQATVVSFTITAYRNGVPAADDDYYDPLISIYDTDGTTELFSNDDVFFYDSALQCLLATPGTYYIVIDEWSGNIGDGIYYLEFEAADFTVAVAEVESNDTSGTAQALAVGNYVTADLSSITDDDYYSFSGTAGDTIRVPYFDVNNSETAIVSVSLNLIDTDGMGTLPFHTAGEYQSASTILTSTGTFYIHVTGPSNTPYGFHLELERASRVETEPNDTVASSDAFDLSGRAAGSITSGTDVDLFAFVAAPNVPLTVFCYADAASKSSNGFSDHSDFGSSMVSTLTILDAASTVLTSATLNITNSYAEGVIEGAASVAVTFNAPDVGTYYVQVSEAFGNFGPNYFYTLQIR